MFRRFINTINIMHNRNIDMFIKKDAIIYEIPMFDEIKQIGILKSIQHKNDKIILEYYKKDPEYEPFNLEDYSYSKRYR